MRALILNGEIVQLAAADFPVHPSLQWVDAPIDATLETHIYVGGVVVPKPPKTPEEIDAETSAAAIVELQKIDLDSIHYMREYLAALPDAPVALKDLEIAAQEARAKVKP